MDPNSPQACSFSTCLSYMPAYATCIADGPLKETIVVCSYMQSDEGTNVLFLTPDVGSEGNMGLEEGSREAGLGLCVQASLAAVAVRYLGTIPWGRNQQPRDAYLLLLLRTLGTADTCPFLLFVGIVTPQNTGYRVSWQPGAVRVSGTTDKFSDTARWSAGAAPQLVLCPRVAPNSTGYTAFMALITVEEMIPGDPTVAVSTPDIITVHLSALQWLETGVGNYTPVMNVEAESHLTKPLTDGNPAFFASSFVLSPA